MAESTIAHHRWDDIPHEPVTRQITRKVITGEREMIAQVFLQKGAIVPMHSHESEQITYLLSGALKFRIGGKEIVVRAGEVLVIPSWLEHEAEALEDTLDVDVFSPIRRDWLDGTDDYFRRGR
jgi:quercetin dioxygenase-like cupin family protein